MGSELEVQIRPERYDVDGERRSSSATMRCPATKAGRHEANVGAEIVWPGKPFGCHSDRLSYERAGSDMTSVAISSPVVTRLTLAALALGENAGAERGRASAFLPALPGWVSSHSIVMPMDSWRASTSTRRGLGAFLASGGTSLNLIGPCYHRRIGFHIGHHRISFAIAGFLAFGPSSLMDASDGIFSPCRCGCDRTVSINSKATQPRSHAATNYIASLDRRPRICPIVCGL